MAETAKEVKINELLEEINRQFVKDFQKGLSIKTFDWERIAMKVNSNSAISDYSWLGQFPRMQEWFGKRQIKKIKAEKMSIKNRLFESTVAVPRVALEDDEVGMFRNMAEQAGASAAELPTDLVLEALRNGLKNNCYDGTPFFGDKHPLFEEADGTGTETEQSNNLKVLANDTKKADLEFFVIDNSQVLKPFIYQERIKAEIEEKFDSSKSDTVFMEDEYLWGVRARGNSGLGIWQYACRVESSSTHIAQAIKKAVATMKNLKVDGGRTLGVRPSLILAPASFEYEFKKILNSEKIDGECNPLYHAVAVEFLPDDQIKSVVDKTANM